jgi:hypothetical protein
MSVQAQPQSQTPDGGTDALSTGRTEPNAQEQRADPTPVSREEPREQDTRGRDFIREGFMRLRGYTQNASVSGSATQPENANASGLAPQAPPASSNPVRESEPSAAQPSGQPSTTFPPAQQQGGQRRGRQGQEPGRPTSATGNQPGSTDQIVLTADELQRRVQSEVDRVIAKQQRDNQTRAAQEQERELRRTDPFAYARLVEEREAELEASRTETARLTDVIGKQLVFYDRAVLDTFVGALPEEDRVNVISQETDGIENRKQTAANALKALRNRYVAEGRASAREALMKDQTFIKEILTRFGHAGPEPEPAPVAVRPARDAAPNDGKEAMNGWIRHAAQSARATTGT